MPQEYRSNTSKRPFQPYNFDEVEDETIPVGVGGVIPLSDKHMDRDMDEWMNREESDYEADGGFVVPNKKSKKHTGESALARAERFRLLDRQLEEKFARVQTSNPELAAQYMQYESEEEEEEEEEEVPKRKGSKYILDGAEECDD